MTGRNTLSWLRKALLIMGLVVLLPFGLSLYPELAHVWLREVSYRHIAEQVEQNSFNDLGKVELATGFFFLNEIDPRPPFPIVDHTVHTDLIRGLGRCDQRVNGLITVLDKLGIEGRFLIFNCHTVAEIYVDKDTLIVDPTENVFWQKTQTESTGTFYWNDSDWRTVKFDGQVIDDYQYTNVSTCSSARRTETLSNRKSFSRKAFDRVIDYYYSVFGRQFLLMLVEWMSLLGYLDDETLYANVLSENELSFLSAKKNRVDELLGFGTCNGQLPCLWNVSDVDCSNESTQFIWAKRLEKSQRLTEFQKELFQGADY